jgi:hypothetical protein
MTARRRAILAVLFALGAGGCNGHFDFDEHTSPPDAGAPADGPTATPADAPGTLPDGPAPGDDSRETPAVCSATSSACMCTGSLCTCARQKWCRFTGSVCMQGTPCGLQCHNGTRCDGQCQQDCRLECEGQSTCTMTLGFGSYAEAESSVLAVTVGPMSEVHCENNATCHVTCTGACTLECQSGARCYLRCAGDTSAQSADMGGSCPG